MNRKYLVLAFIIFICHDAAMAVRINVKDYGAKGDGKTDDTRAIQRAIDDADPAMFTTVFFPAGAYLIGSYIRTSKYLENYCLLFHSNIHFEGEKKHTILRLASHLFDKRDTGANAHIFKAVDVKNVVFSDLIIDMNGSENLVPSHVIKNHSAIFVIVGEHMRIYNMTIKNCAGTNMIDVMGPGKGLLIENCRFLNGGNYVGTSKPNKNQYDFSFVYTEWDSTIVKNNEVVQQNIDIGLSANSGGVELHGSACVAENNFINGCWPAFFITSMKENNDVMIANNKLVDCVVGVIFWLAKPARNVTIKNNSIRLTRIRSPKAWISTAVEIPNGNAKEYNSNLANGAPVYSLKIYGNKISAPQMSNLCAGMVLHSVHGGLISDNIVKGMNYTGVLLTGSKWGMDSLTIRDNLFTDFRPNYDQHAVGGYVVATDTYSGIKDSAGFKNILIENNTFKKLGSALKSPAKKKGQFYKSFIELPAGSKGQVRFIDNHFPADSGEFMTVSPPER